MTILQNVIHGLFEGCLRAVRELPVDCFSTVGPWAVGGLSMGCPWAVYGSVGCPWAVRRLSAEYPRAFLPMECPWKLVKRTVDELPASRPQAAVRGIFMGCPQGRCPWAVGGLSVGYSSHVVPF